LKYLSKNDDIYYEMGISTNANVCAVFKTYTLGGRLAATPLFRALGKRFGKNVAIVADHGTADFFKTNPYGIRVFDFGEGVPNYCEEERPAYVDEIQKCDFRTVIVLPLSESSYAELAAHKAFPNSSQRIGSGSMLENFLAGRQHSFPGFFGSDIALDHYKTNVVLNADVNIPFPEPYRWDDPDIKYIGDSFLQYIRAMGIEESYSRPEVWTTDDDAVAAQRHLERHDVNKNDLLIGVNVQGATVQWPMEYAARIIRYFLSPNAEQLLGKKPKIFANYSLAESGYASRLMSLLPQDSRIIPSPIPGNHRLSAELIKKCSYLITAQSGPAVIAQCANVDTPCSVLYRGTSLSKAWMYPGARVMPFIARGEVDNIKADEVYFSSISAILEWFKK